MTLELLADPSWILAAPLEPRRWRKLGRSILCKEENSFSLSPPLTLASSFVCCSRVASHDSSKGRRYINTSYAHKTAISPSETRALVIEWHFWQHGLYLWNCERVLNVGPRQSAISSLTNLWATESMRMILTSIDCEGTGNRGLLQSW